MATGYLKQDLKRPRHFDFFVDNEISVGFEEHVKEVGEIEGVLDI